MMHKQITKAEARKNMIIDAGLLVFGLVLIASAATCKAEEFHTISWNPPTTYDDYTTPIAYDCDPQDDGNLLRVGCIASFEVRYSSTYISVQEPAKTITVPGNCVAVAIPKEGPDFAAEILAVSIEGEKGKPVAVSTANQLNNLTYALMDTCKANPGVCATKMIPFDSSANLIVIRNTTPKSR